MENKFIEKIKLLWQYFFIPFFYTLCFIPIYNYPYLFIDWNKEVEVIQHCDDECDDFQVEVNKIKPYLVQTFFLMFIVALMVAIIKMIGQIYQWEKISEWVSYFIIFLGVIITMSLESNIKHIDKRYFAEDDNLRITFIKAFKSVLLSSYLTNKQFPLVLKPNLWGGECTNDENSVLGNILDMEEKKGSPIVLPKEIRVKSSQDFLCIKKSKYPFGDDKAGVWYKSFDYQGGKNNAYVICSSVLTDDLANINLDLIKDGKYEEIKEMINTKKEITYYQKIPSNKWGYCIAEDAESSDVIKHFRYKRWKM